MSAWQLIETAPKDGTHIILWGAQDPNNTSLFPSIIEGYWKPSRNAFVTKPDIGICFTGETHWMPLPKAPA